MSKTSKKSPHKKELAETEKKTAAKGSDQKKSSENKKKKDKKPFPLFTIVSVLVVLSLVCLAITIIAPGLVDRVFRSSPIERGDIVMTIGDYEVTAEEYIYTALIMKNSYTAYYGDNFFEKNPQMEQDVLETVETYFKSKAAQLAFAAEKGIVLTEEGEKEATVIIDKIKENLSEEEWQQMLSVGGATEELMFKIECDNWVMRQLDRYIFDPDGPYVTGITDEERIEASEELGLMCIKQILILGSNNAAQDAKKLALAEEIAQRLRDGEDFDTLMQEYSEDAEWENNPQGYFYFYGYGTIFPEIEDIVFGLEMGQHSGVISVLYEDYRAYYIVMRIVPELQDLDDYVIKLKVDAELKDLLETMKIKYARGYKYISMSQIEAPAADLPEGNPDDVVDPENGSDPDDVVDLDNHDDSGDDAA